MKAWIYIIFYISTAMFHVLAKENQIDNIIAIVNDQIILNSDVDKILLFFKKEGKDVKIPLKNNFLKEAIIQKLIIDNLMLQEANKMNVEITSKQVDNVIKNMALKKHITVNEFKNYIIFNNIDDPFAYENYLDNIKNLLKMKTIQDYELHKRVIVSEQEVNTLFKKLIKKNEKFKKINVSYILIPFYKQQSQDIFRNKKILSERIVNNLKKGYDFEKSFIKYKKNNSIFLVKKMFWTHLGDLQNTFSNSLNILKKGQIIGPILEKKGFYVLKVNDIYNNRENIITQFHIQHCLLKPSLFTTDREVKNNIFDIYKKITTGVYSFNYAVKNLSDDFNSFNKKGDLGWILIQSFNRDFKNSLSHLNKNEISKPVKSNFGWHIVKLLNKRQIDNFYNFTKKDAYNILLDQKMNIERNNWIKDLKNFSYIKIIR